MKKIYVFAFVVMLAAQMVGQSMTSSGGGTWNTPTMISNFPDVLVSGGNVNAWHPLYGWGGSISAGIGGPTMVVGGSPTGQAYVFDGINNWNLHSEYGNVHQIAYGGDGNVYALYGTCASGYNFGRWNGSAFTLLTSCFESFSLAADGSTAVLLVDANGTLWQGDTSSGNWQHVSNAPFPVLTVASIANGVYEAVKRDNTIWRSDGTTLEQVPGSAITVASGPNPNELYIIDTNNNPAYWDGTNNTWDEIASPGSFTALAVGSMGPWAVGPHSSIGYIYRLSEYGVEWSRTYSGSVTCNVPPPGQQICTTFHHTANLQICTKRKCGAVSSAVPWNNSGSWGLTAKVHTNDILDCFVDDPNPSDCVIEENQGDMQCSGGGNNADNPGSPSYGVAIDVQAWTGNSGGQAPFDVGNGIDGAWLASLTQATTEDCQVGMPTCYGSGRQITGFRYPYSTMAGYYLMQEEIWRQYNIYLTGAPSPWVYYIPWIRTGSGQISCAPFSGFINGVPKYHKFWDIPACQ